MLHRFSRTELLIGTDALNKLKLSKVAIFGIGGVGSYAAEGLVRSGISHIVLIDDDKICLTNLNRQIHATVKTVGMDKVDAMKQRILEINPQAEVEVYKTFVTDKNVDTLVRPDYDYIIDAVDTISAKLALVIESKAKNIPIISCMGAGNKLDPSKFEFTDISKTTMCPVARVMRKELRKRGIASLNVLYSTEQPIAPKAQNISTCRNCCICPKGTKRKCTKRRQIPGSISFVPSVAGLLIAGYIVNEIIKK